VRDTLDDGVNGRSLFVCDGHVEDSISLLIWQVCSWLGEDFSADARGQWRGRLSLDLTLQVITLVSVITLVNVLTRVYAETRVCCTNVPTVEWF